uniref:Secreted protein n=1 Tax=Steinernema glaseri TaxID=37863 RepID=A0A1I8AJP5_9BILA
MVGQRLGMFSSITGALTNSLISFSDSAILFAPFADDVHNDHELAARRSSGCASRYHRLRLSCIDVFSTASCRRRTGGRIWPRSCSSKAVLYRRCPAKMERHESEKSGVCDNAPVLLAHLCTGY